MLIYSIFWKVLESFSTKSGVKNCWKTEDRTAERQHNQHWPNMGPHTHKCRSNMAQDGSKNPRWWQMHPKKTRVNFQKKTRVFWNLRRGLFCQFLAFMWHLSPHFGLQNGPTSPQYTVCIPTKREIVAQKTPLRTSIWTQT